MGLKGLVKRGIVIMVPSVTDDNRPNGRDKDRYLLSSRACSVLFKGQDHLIGYDSLCRMAELHKSTSIRAKQLLFDEGFLPRIEEIKAILAPEKYDYLMDKFGGKGLNKSLNILFHGAPGTGKTELAMQLARECGRDIFVPDLARLEDSYIGESEKNYRELFRCFRYLAAISLYPPILLLNEADGIISRRVEVHRSSDKYMNSIQNILLEEMERFEGILIATTNITSNIDKAFERRFTFKLRFQRPSPATASRLWLTRLPYLSPADAIWLASEFPQPNGRSISTESNSYRSLHSGKHMSIVRKSNCPKLMKR